MVLQTFANFKNWFVQTRNQGLVAGLFNKKNLKHE